MVLKVSHNAASSRERLSRISHHFLSEDSTPAPALARYTTSYTNRSPNIIPDQNRQPFVLPVLMDPQQENHFPVYALSQALLAHKKSSAVLLVEGERTSSPCTTLFNIKDGAPQDDGTTQGATKNHPFPHMLQHTPDIYLIPIASIKSVYVASYQRVLMPVPASIIGIRTAYIQLKRLVDESREINAGITMTQTSDPDWARRCFEKLAAAAQAFLDLKITSYGCLPDMEHTGSLIPPLMAHHKGGLPHEMIDVDDLILLDLENHRRESANKKPSEEPIMMTSTVGIP